MATEPGSASRRPGANEAGRHAGPWWRRVLWFVAIWCASLTVLSAVAYGIRAMIL